MLARYVYPAVILALAFGLLAVACGDDEDEEEVAPTATVQEVAPTATVDEVPAAGSDVEVLLDEWSVVADPSTVSAGSVTFTAINGGEEDHELVIVKTDLAPDALPVVDGKVDEVAAGEEIGEIEDVLAASEKQATFELEPGSYVLFCNILEEEESGELESHYEEGMHTAFEVTE